MTQTYGNHEQKDEKIRLSVVIPLHNGLPYFERTINSILQQTYNLSNVEVLVVDNGSTDGSSAYIDRVASEYPSLFSVWHQKDSGGPSNPRNRAMNNARGEYLFFCDADDYFGPEAFERMLQHADEWNSDLLLVKVAGIHGRNVPVSMFHIDQKKADVWSSRVFNSLAPWKLFRRSLINGKKFADNLCVREDELFIAQCMFDAETISVASDYVYYYVEQREDEANLTARAQADFEDRFEVFACLLDIVKMTHSYDCEKAAQVVFPQMLRSSWLSCLAAVSQSAISNDEKEAQLARLHSISGEVLSDSAIDRLPPSLQMICLSFRDHEDTFALQCLSLIKLTHNGSFLNHTLAEKDCCVDTQGIATWKVAFDDRCRILDVSQHLPFSYNIEDIEIGETSIIFMGTYQQNDFWIGSESVVRLIIDEKSENSRYAIPCVIDKIESDRVFWHVEVLFELLEKMLQKKKKNLGFSLNISRGNYTRTVRFGAKIESDCACRLFGWKRSTKDKAVMLVPRCSLMGNLTVGTVLIPLDYEINDFDISQNSIALRGVVLLTDYWCSSTNLAFFAINRQTKMSYSIPIKTSLSEKTLIWSVDLLQVLQDWRAHILTAFGSDIDFYIKAESRTAKRKKRFGSEFPETLVQKITEQQLFAGHLKTKRFDASFTDSGNLSLKIIRGADR